MSKTPKNTFYLTAVLLCIPIVIWVWYRAIHLEFTHDEAYSFFIAKNNKWNQAIGTANNHWLNTLFLWLEYGIFDSKEIFLRLHSVIAFHVFLYFVVRTIYEQAQSILALLLFFLMLVYNHYFLDFFSLARGYALGVTFQSICFYYLLKPNFLQHRNKIFLFIILSCIAVYINVFALLGIILFDIYFFIRSEKVYKSNIANYFKPYFWITPILLLIILNLWKIKISGDLEQGNTNGLIHDTYTLFYFRAFQFVSNFQTVYTIVKLVLLLTSIYFIYTLVRKQNNHTFQRLVQLLFIINFIQWLFFYIFRTPFSYERTAIYILLPWVYTTTFLITSFLSNPKFSIIIFVCIIFEACYPFYYNRVMCTTEWWMNVDTKKMIEYIQQIDKKPLNQLKIGILESQNGVLRNYLQQVNEEKYTIGKILNYKFYKIKDLNMDTKNQFKTLDYLFLRNYSPGQLDTSISNYLFPIKKFTFDSIDLLKVIPISNKVK